MSERKFTPEQEKEILECLDKIFDKHPNTPVNMLYLVSGIWTQMPEYQKINTVDFGKIIMNIIRNDPEKKFQVIPHKSKGGIMRKVRA